MGEIVAGVIQKQLSGGAEVEKQMSQNQNAANGRSFESVLQQKDGQIAPSAETSATNRTGDMKMDAMRVDLMQRYQNLPEGVPKVTAIFPEFLDTKTRMSAFRNILNQAIDSGNSGAQTKDVVSRFSQTEEEWFKLENVMRSDKELSQGELLGLQARLYQVSQHIDVLSKVIDQMSSGVKTILNTNV